MILFKVFYANWPIGEPVKLGDYGIMNGRIFIEDNSPNGTIFIVELPIVDLK